MFTHKDIENRSVFVIIVAYDISNNKVRTQFSKFLEKYGVRVQFSVFEIQNS